MMMYQESGWKEESAVLETLETGTSLLATAESSLRIGEGGGELLLPFTFLPFFFLCLFLLDASTMRSDNNSQQEE